MAQCFSAMFLFNEVSNMPYLIQVAWDLSYLCLVTLLSYRCLKYLDEQM